MEKTIHEAHIAAGGGYTVAIGPGLLKESGSRIAAAAGRCRVAVITDSTVAPLYLDTVRESLAQAGLDSCACVYPAGEQSKNLSQLARLLEFLAGEQLTRADCVAALGGGVCGDMAGFAAGVYLRGIRYVQLPTTLLAAVDSSVGGKTAVDLTAGKNLAGVFLQPSAVVCDTDCLGTLPGAVFADGAAEAIKTGVLAGETLFSRLENGVSADDPALPELIGQCVAYKGRVVEADERDTGVRRTLNLGHTAGHAIELCSGYTVPHGHAVAMGMALIARASEKLGWCAQPCAERIAAALERSGLPVSTAEYTPQALARAALTDKKRMGGTLSLVIPERIGGCVMRDVPVEALSAVFAAGQEG